MPNQRPSKSRVAFTSVSTARALFPASHALASQGPGAVTQLAMTLVIYGASAAVIATGLIGALRGQ
jgi:hypothetical protein